MPAVHRAGGNMRRRRKKKQNPEPGCGRGKQLKRKQLQAANRNTSSRRYYTIVPISKDIWTRGIKETRRAPIFYAVNGEPEARGGLLRTRMPSAALLPELRASAESQSAELQSAVL
jgi:hypothetical protein